MEAVGLVSSVISGSLRIAQFAQQIVVPEAHGDEFWLLVRENLFNPLAWVALLRGGVLQVAHRIRHYVLSQDPAEAWRMKESFKDTFALQAVSSAIVAQIAISMLGLADFGSIHWTATAFAYASLVTGLLATYFAFYVQQILSDLHTPEDVRYWLTAPRANYLSRLRGPREVEYNLDRIPSLMAAWTLTAPSRLLQMSILALFVALCIYLSSVYAESLGDLGGYNANLAVLLFIIFVTAWALFESVVPVYSKDLDMINAPLAFEAGRLLEERRPGTTAVPHMRAANDGDTNRAATHTDEAIREALQASIVAQEEHLAAQRRLLQLLETQAR